MSLPVRFRLANGREKSGPGHEGRLGGGAGGEEVSPKFPSLAVAWLTLADEIHEVAGHLEIALVSESSRTVENGRRPCGADERDGDVVGVRRQDVGGVSVVPPTVEAGKVFWDGTPVGVRQLAA